MCSQKILLLSASNMDSFPVYPYAFIQVPAVARRAGIQVICKDLLGIPQGDWQHTVQSLIDRHDPAMILITLRNTDSLNIKDYDRGELKKEDGNAFFPIDQTKALIATIRVVSDLRITVGGFGFSLLPDDLMHHLRPDFGVFGGPDAFFAFFEDIKQGEYAHIANLLFFLDGQLVSNPRTFYPPLADTEYTSHAIKEMMDFYESFSSPGFLGAPVEIMRGCNHTCVFCAEPHVAGARVQYRDLSAVMKDIEILVDHGITQIYIISSELNPEGNEFVLQLADSIRSFNVRQAEDRKVTWFGANYLLNFEIDDYEQLYKSGFTGGWFDITALDDENARAMRTPYRNKRLLPHLKAHVQFEKRGLDLLPAQEASNPEIMDGVHDTNGTKDSAIKWSMFLGNPATTTQTIRNTLRVANQEGLAQLFDSCFIITNIRVFDYEKPNKATLAVSNSFNLNLERTSYQQILPSFAYPPALLQVFGSEEEIAVMFDHIAETYLSTKYQETRDWHGFIKRKGTATSIISWLAELSNTQGVHVPAYLGGTSSGTSSRALQKLFSEEPPIVERRSFEVQAIQVVDSLLSACLEAFPEIFGALGFPRTMEKLERMIPYKLAVAIFSRWSFEDELFDELTRQAKPVLNGSLQDFIQFCIQATLYRFNVLLRPQYRELFVSADLKVSERG